MDLYIKVDEWWCIMRRKDDMLSVVVMVVVVFGRVPLFSVTGIREKFKIGYVIHHSTVCWTMVYELNKERQ